MVEFVVVLDSEDLEIVNNNREKYPNLFQEVREQIFSGEYSYRLSEIAYYEYGLLLV